MSQLSLKTRKIPFVGSCYLIKFRGKKLKATSQVILTSHYKMENMVLKRFYLWCENSAIHGSWGWMTNIWNRGLHPRCNMPKCCNPGDIVYIQFSGRNQTNRKWWRHAWGTACCYQGQQQLDAVWGNSNGTSTRWCWQTLLCTVNKMILGAQLIFIGGSLELPILFTDGFFAKLFWKVERTCVHRF